MITRQSTARTILVGPVLDSTGAAKTDEVVASIKITKNGTVGAANGSATLTHNHAGKYLLALTSSDTDTVGVLEISLNSGTNDMPVKGLNVVETAVWDALFADGATGFATATNVTDAQTAIITQVDANETKIDTVIAKTNNLPSDPADQSVIITATDAILTAVGTRSSQTSVDDLPTNAELATALGTSDDAMLAAIATVQSDTNDIQTRLPAALVGGKMDSTAVLDSATQTQITNIENAAGYTLAVLAGACADPQTASETYAITVFGSTFTVDMAGQTSTGTRTAPTLTKA